MKNTNMVSTIPRLGFLKKAGMIVLLVLSIFTVVYAVENIPQEHFTRGGIPPIPVTPGPIPQPFWTIQNVSNCNFRVDQWFTGYINGNSYMTTQKIYDVNGNNIVINGGSTYTLMDEDITRNFEVSYIDSIKFTSLAIYFGTTKIGDFYPNENSDCICSTELSPPLQMCEGKF